MMFLILLVLSVIFIVSLLIRAKRLKEKNDLIYHRQWRAMYEKTLQK